MVREADGAPPGCEDRANLFDLVAEVDPRRRGRAPSPEKARSCWFTPACWRAMIRWTCWTRLRDQVGRKGACPGMWVLVAADEQSELPLIDGREVPLICSGQRARVPDSPG